eukprot:GSChrysophyteH2.ASY1.ANO1.1215.1 assembled CDS
MRTKKTGAKYDFLLKLLLIGDSGVGKSCLLLRYSDDSFTHSFITTIVKLQIWDTAGQERFRTITTAYYRGAMGIFLVFDITDGESFENVHNWMRQIDQNAADNVTKLLLGNKCDVEASKRVVARSAAEALANEYGIAYFETSAKKDIGVDDAFDKMATTIVEHLKVSPDHYGSEGGISLNNKSSASKSGAQAPARNAGGCC